MVDSSADPPTGPCPACGALLGGRAGCQAAFDRQSAASWSSPERGGAHNLLVDAYAMQHPEEYGLSAKSYAQHLIALGCGVEHPGDSRLYWAIPRWIEAHGPPAKPPLLVDRGGMTVADLERTRTDSEYRESVRALATEVWEAYRSQWPLARASLDAVRAGMGPSR